jgi:GTPase SAR1 family protein
LPQKHTYTQTISWWPLISILGTFSAGKSSFLNSLLEEKIQQTGNQAVDDKFTAICYSKNEEPTTLPGIALDADPRFPFYNISREIEKIEPGTNINRYLQLKAIKSEPLKGKIFIDSPGFDADTQRDAVLRITRHIIDLSDLVLIFFDARHPEPGAMRDTLNHLVEIAKSRADDDKVLYILNQIDTCAKEDNLEEIIGAWQRALSQKGIVSGKFYAIYNQDLASFSDKEQEGRLRRKRDEDLGQILEKMEKVRIDRAYRIVKNIEQRAKEILDLIPFLSKALNRFKKSLLAADLIMIVAVVAAAWYAYRQWGEAYIIHIAAIGTLIFFAIHFKLRSIFVHLVAKRLKNSSLRRAFLKQTRWYRPYLLTGISKNISYRLNDLIERSRVFIQRLNDQYVLLQKEQHLKPKEESF